MFLFYIAQEEEALTKGKRSESDAHNAHGEFVLRRCTYEGTFLGTDLPHVRSDCW